MFDTELEDFENIEEAQVRFGKANEAGYEKGLAGENYTDPFEAIPDLCRDRRNKMDRFVAFHFDRGYLTAYGVYLKNHPDAAEDIRFRKMVEKYCIVDEAQRRGVIAYEEGRSGAAVVTEVYELLPGPANDMNLAIYDGWEFGYLLGMMYDDNRKKKNDWPEFDYDRAYALLNTTELLNEEPVRADKLTIEERIKLANEQMGGTGIKESCKVPPEVVIAFMNAREIVSATEDNELVECLTCPYHYGMHTGESCDRDCYVTALKIQDMIGTEDDVLRAWLVHR